MNSIEPISDYFTQAQMQKQDADEKTSDTIFAAKMPKGLSAASESLATALKLGVQQPTPDVVLVQMWL